MFVRRIIQVGLLGRIVVLGPVVNRQWRRDQVCFVLGELNKEDDADGPVGLREPGNGIIENGAVGFGEAALHDKGRVFGVVDVDFAIGFGSERHGCSSDDEMCW